MQPFSLNIHGALHHFNEPVVMGILNITPDSFYKASRVQTEDEISRRAELMMVQGAGILDVGACSTRPGSTAPSEEEELERLHTGMRCIRHAVGRDVLISVDTYRASVARAAVAEWGADIVNDISSGEIDPGMFDTVAELKVPYILMHMRGTPADMHLHTDYTPDVTTAVIAELEERVYRLEEKGVADIIVDPGFGFAKTLEQNYRLMDEMERFRVFRRPILVGVSRKRMVTQLLGIPAEDALVPTAALHMLALERGAAILRTHDVTQARQCIEIFKALHSH